MNPIQRIINGQRTNLVHQVQNEMTQFNRCRLLGIWRSSLERAVLGRGPHPFIQTIVDYVHLAVLAPDWPLLAA